MSATHRLRFSLSALHISRSSVRPATSIGAAPSGVPCQRTNHEFSALQICVIVFHTDGKLPLISRVRSWAESRSTASSVRVFAQSLYGRSSRSWVSMGEEYEHCHPRPVAPPRVGNGARDDDNRVAGVCPAYSGGAAGNRDAECRSRSLRSGGGDHRGQYRLRRGCRSRRGAARGGGRTRHDGRRTYHGTTSHCLSHATAFRPYAGFVGFYFLDVGACANGCPNGIWSEWELG